MYSSFEIVGRHWRHLPINWIRSILYHASLFLSVGCDRRHIPALCVFNFITFIGGLRGQHRHQHWTGCSVFAYLVYINRSLHLSFILPSFCLHIKIQSLVSTGISFLYQYIDILISMQLHYSFYVLLLFVVPVGNLIRKWRMLVSQINPLRYYCIISYLLMLVSR